MSDPGESTPHLSASIAFLDDAAGALRDARLASEADPTWLAHYSHVIRGLRDALAELEIP